MKAPVSFRPTIALLAALVSLLVASSASATPWPGSAAVSVVDGENVFGQNLSGLAYQPSGTSAPGALWAVQNDPPTLFRMVWNGSIWTPDTTNGWTNGKALKYAGGGGVPDTEGVTLAESEPNTVFVSVERDDSGGVMSNTSRPSVLRYDVSAAGTTLDAAVDFNLTPDLPGLGANTSLEGVAWVPDAFLVSQGFKDESTGLAYNPATYPEHGTGLFFVGIEQTGQIVAYALKQSDGTYVRVATIASGLPEVMEVTYDPESTHLWAVCDNHCNGQATTLDIAQSGPSAGAFVATNTYDRPTGMPNLNNEGFAIAAQAECVSGKKPVFYSDDSNTDNHALRAGTIDCAPARPPGGGGGGKSDTKVDGSASIAKSQRQKARKIVVKVTVTGAEALTAAGTGKVKAGKRSYALAPLSVSVAAGGSAVLKLKPAKSSNAAKIAKFLAKGRKAKAAVSIVLTDAAGNRSTQPLSAKLTG